tara:strand:- start:87 stop:1010 length:924 start_codon:yes stop_codon:yes gene_type:complete
MSSSFVRFEQAPVTIDFAGSGAGKECGLLASNLTVGENTPLQAVRALGYNGAVAVAANGPIEGTFSITYNLVNTRETKGSAVCTGSKMEADGNCDWVTSSTVMTYGSGKYISLKVGTGDDLFSQGLANSLSVTAEPNSIITATLGGNYYDGGIQAASVTAGAGTAANGSLAVAHGAATSPSTTGLGFSCDPFSANYEASRGFNPIYSLGSLDARFVMVTDPQQSITYQGEQIPAGGGSDVNCLDPTNASLTVNDQCGQEITTLNVCGFIQSRDIEIAENDVLRGNITIVDYTGLQQSLDGAECGSGT